MGWQPTKKQGDPNPQNHLLTIWGDLNDDLADLDTLRFFYSVEGGIN